MNKILSTLLFTVLCITQVFGQEPGTYKLNAGLRIQKSVGFYTNNGLAVEYSTPKILKQKICFGFNAVSSRLGSAFLNNGFAYSEVQISAIKFFRPTKSVKPLVRLNMGYAHARFGSAIFKDIPNSSPIVSFETGVAWDMKKPLRLAVSGGYNFISGNGASGFGMVWPIFGQFSVLYRIR